MSSPNSKPEKTLKEITVETVTSVYNTDEVSRVMPTKNNHTSKSEVSKYMNRNDCSYAI
jgi:hypothetical protein